MSGVCADEDDALAAVDNFVAEKIGSVSTPGISGFGQKTEFLLVHAKRNQKRAGGRKADSSVPKGGPLSRLSTPRPPRKGYGGQSMSTYSSFRRQLPTAGRFPRRAPP